jgi:phage baseplate assembly protein gpV
LKFDDTSGAERIEIIGQSGDHKLVIDVSGKKIEISCASGDIVISAPAGKLSLDAQQIAIKASTTLDIKASGAMTINGQTVAIN